MKKKSKRRYLGYDRCVYVVATPTEGLLKLGMTHNMAERFKAHKKYYGNNCRILYVTEYHIIGALVENDVLKILKQYKQEVRDNGQEVFKVSAEIAIATVKTVFAEWLKRLPGYAIRTERISLLESAKAYIALKESFGIYNYVAEARPPPKKPKRWPSAIRDDDSIDNT